MNKIQQSVLNNDDINEADHYESILKKVKKESIQQAAANYLSGENLIKFIVKPEHKGN